MQETSGLLLVGAVAAVGVLHTIVPDHWVPITLIARQRGWSRAETARAAFRAGLGHVLSTLTIALVVWIAGVAVAARFGAWINSITSFALVAFGGWIAVSAWRGLHGHGGHEHSHEHAHGHSQDHHHHEMAPGGIHRPELQRTATEPVHGADYAGHSHHHPAPDNSRTALLLILGSSPMVEGIPAFFAASKYGAGLIILMSIVFGLSTIVTYMLLCVYSTVGLQRVRLGPLERYGEVLSGGFIALVGLAFWIWPVL